MPMIRNFIAALIVISVMAFHNQSQAETPELLKEGQKIDLTSVKSPKLATTVDPELQCLAKNIYYESRSQPLEGKVAVGLVTLNRVKDARFANTVCGVVHQKSRKSGGCQFSWYCHKVSPPSRQDWLESLRVARELLYNRNVYGRLKEKYANALYFHERRVRPRWAIKKYRVGSVGNHLFYGD